MTLKLGMVGGGQGAFIGGVHRMAARLDGRWELVAGALSSDPARAAASAADLGIAPELEPRADHTSYLQSWLKVLSDDKRAIFQAAAHAQRAVSFLHDLQPAASSETIAA